MNQTIQERNLLFHFDPSVQVLKYDECSFYKNRSNQTLKAVDFICMHALGQIQAYYIEAKDFRTITKPPSPANLRDIHITVVTKFENTRIGLSMLSNEVQYDPDDRFAMQALSAKHNTLVLHLEPHARDTNYMFSKALIANIMQQTKILIRQKNLVAEVKCLNAAETNQKKFPWTVTLLP